MNKLVSTMAFLLTVISSAATYASVDSVSLTSYCKLVSLDDAQKYRIMYQGAANEDVKVLLHDDKNQLVYSEVISDTDGFVKIYDLSEIEEGKYSFTVKSKSFKYSEEFVMQPWKADGLVISATDDQKVALLGNAEQDYSISIVDGEGQLVFTDDFNKDQAVGKLFNLQQLEGNQASFIIRKGNKVIRESIVKL